MAKKERKQATQPVSLITVVNPSSPVSEQYRTIRTNIQFSAELNKPIKTIVVTSSGPSEGKSTTSANLSVVFANTGLKTLIVDADMRKPTVHKTFGMNRSTGLSSVITNIDNLVSSIKQTEVENLYVLSSGPKTHNPSELLGSQRMVEVTNQLREMFDIIIFDMPPLLAVTDAQIMASRVDGTILVARENVTSKEGVLRSQNLLNQVHANILGVVYNGTKSTKDAGYYYFEE